MIIFFDLPTVTKTDIREYTHFVKGIKKMGFVMYQESVYTKLCLNESIVNSTQKEIKKALPKDGFVSLLTLTEQQFNSIVNLIGDYESDVETSDERVIKL